MKYFYHFTHGMTVHCTSRKNYERKHRFKWANLIFNCLKTLILNFAYIHSKRRKLCMFILFQKFQFVYPNKVNSPISFIFNFWYVMGKNSFCSRSPGARYLSFISSAQTFDAGLKPIEPAGLNDFGGDQCQVK